MGATLSNDSRSDVKPEEIKLRELSPQNIKRLRDAFLKNPTSTRFDKKQIMSSLKISQRETDILFDYFDMDGNGQIDNYELTCAIAMIVHSSIDLRSEFLFKLYDLDSNNFLSRDEIINLVRTITICKNRPVISSDIETKTDDIIKVADLDLDKKLSLKEFQSYAAKNREVFTIMDAYSPLLVVNPIDNATGAKKNKKKPTRDAGNEGEESDPGQEEGSDNGEEEGNNEFAEDDIGGGDEMDPDLYEELQKEKDADNRTEAKENIKKGVEFGNGFAEEDVEGDEFGACKPWLTNVQNTVPSNYKPSKLDGTTPDAQLELEFVHGYRCHDTRNNLRYTESGEIVYHTAAVGIVYNKEEHKQRFFIEHFDDITAMAIHPNKKYVATGEIGPYPLISIWDTENNTALVRIREPLQKGINHLAFSRDGKYLVATAADDAHNVAIFDWEKGQAEDLSTITNCRLRVKKGQAQCKGPVLGTCEGGRANILGVCFNKTGDTVAMACVKEVNFITVGTGKLKKRKATGLRGDNLTSIMCCGYLNNTLLCGSMKGKLLVCAGTQFTKTMKAHASSMNSIYIRENDIGFITGGSDGMILVWDTKYSVTNRLSIKSEEIHSLCPRVRSIDEDTNGNILIGTRGGEILEFANGTPTVYLRGHWDKELWGLCVHPSKDVYFTVGEDKLLAVWDVATMKMKQYCVLEEEGTVIDISPNGKDLCIGTETGNWYIYDANTLKKKTKKKESVTKAVEEIKYSPCGNYLAIGGIDKDTDGFMHIFLYDVSQNYKRIKKMKGHTSRVTHIDWSADSEYIQSNSTSYELLYHSISSGVQITKISSMRDVDWQTWTCVLGWPVQGIWPECAAGDDINACDIDKTRRVIVTADDYSKVKLFRYPSPVEKAAFNQYNGHSSHVTCVRFSSNNKHVFSTGGNDKAIFQFKFHFDEEAAEEAEELQQLTDDENNVDDDQQDDYFKEEEMGDADEFGASKPWIGELQASSPKIKIDKNSGLAPRENIKKLRYVFGYRAFDTRMNVKYTGEENKIVYHTAALGVVLDKKTNEQRYFTNHEEDIVSLAIHPNGTTVATGQMAAKGKAKMIDLFVWDINGLPEETNVLADDRENYPDGVTNLKGCLLRAIRILQFSPDGNKLLSGGQDDYNSVAVHDTSNLRKITLIGTCKVDGARVLDAVWRSNNEFVTVGPKHIKFFKVSGRNITPTKGVFGKVKIEPLVSVASAFGKLFTGTDKGNIITWEGSNASTVKNICKNGPLYTLYYYEKDKILFAGGFDGIIYAYDSAKLNEKYKLDIQKITSSPTNCGIRALDANDKGEMLVGTKGGEIVEINLKTKTLQKTLMRSHSESELWGVTINPTNNWEVASGGGDKTLRIWDIKKNVQKKFMMFPEDFRAIDWSSDGKFIIVGTMPGLIYYVDVEKWKRSTTPFKSIFYADSKQKVKQKSDKDKWIQELKISPNNEYVAFGSHCGLGNTFSKIQVLQVTGNEKNPLKAYVTVDPKITSALTHLDWSNDNDRIVCNSLAFELKYVSVAAKSVIKSSSCVWEEDLWHTWTCLFGFPVQGIWPPASTGYIVNYTCLSNNKKVVATGDDFSLVKLFKSPCVVEHASYKAYGGHSSHVPKVRFTPNDRFLVSVGGNDKSVFIWETDFGTQGDDDEEDENVSENNEEENQENQEEEEEPEPEPPKKKKKTKKPVEEEPEEEEEPPEPPKKKKKTKKPVEEEPEEEEEPEPEPPKKKKKAKKVVEEEPEEEEEPEPEPPKKKKKAKKVVEEEPEEEEEEPEPPKKKKKAKKVIEEEPEEEEEEPEPPKKKKKAKKQLIEEEEEVAGDQAVPEPTNGEDDEEAEYRELQKQSEAEKSIPRKKKRREEEEIRESGQDTRENAGGFAEDEVGLGDNAGNPDSGINSGEQWRQACEIPDNIKEFAPDSEKPKVKFDLDYIYGYRTKDGRNNAKYLFADHIFYYAGNVGIIHDIELNEQKFIFSQQAEISCFTTDTLKTLIVTGENAGKRNNCTIKVWEIETLNEIKKFTVPVSGINTLSFSPDGTKLVCTGLDDDHTVFLVDFNTGEIVAKEKGNEKKILSIAFRTDNEFATSGINHFKIWTIKDGKELVGVDGIFQGEGADKKLGVVVATNNIYITGGSTGIVQAWNREQMRNGVKAHSEHVDSLFANEKIVISGSRDCALSIMDLDLKILRRIQLDNGISNVVDPSPRSIDVFNKSTEKILVGTLGGEILELKFEKDFLYSDYTPVIYNSSHYSKTSKENNEITSIVFWPSKDIFCTSGEDGTLRFWNYRENHQDSFLRIGVTEKEQNYKPTSMDLSPKENTLLIGLNVGKIRVYSTDDFSILKEFAFRKHPISVIKYSPDGNYFACGTSDETRVNVIDVFNNQTYQLMCTIKGQVGKITHLDWSTNSDFLSSSSQDGEIRFYNVKKGVMIENYSLFKNEEWATWTRSYGWPVMGYYDSGAGKITACERFDKKISGDKVIAIGDENGEIRLYKYPIVAQDQHFASSEVRHSQKVTNVKFSENIKSGENNIIMSSGSDGCLMKWKLIDEN